MASEEQVNTKSINLSTYDSDYQQRTTSRPNKPKQLKRLNSGGSASTPNLSNAVHLEAIEAYNEKEKDRSSQKPRSDRYKYIKSRLDTGKNKSKKTDSQLKLSKEFQISRGQIPNSTTEVPHYVGIIEHAPTDEGGSACHNRMESTAQPNVGNPSEYELPPTSNIHDSVKTLEKQKQLLDQQQKTEKLIRSQLMTKEITLSPENETEMDYTTSSPQTTTSYKTPRKTSKMATLIQTPPSTNTYNRFEPLANNQGSEIEITRKAAKTIKPRRENENHQRYCPPIIIQGIPKSHNELIKELNQNIKRGYYLKYTLLKLL